MEGSRRNSGNSLEWLLAEYDREIAREIGRCFVVNHGRADYRNSHYLTELKRERAEIFMMMVASHAGGIPATIGRHADSVNILVSLTDRRCRHG